MREDAQARTCAKVRRKFWNASAAAKRVTGMDARIGKTVADHCEVKELSGARNVVDRYATYDDTNPSCCDDLETGPHSRRRVRLEHSQEVTSVSATREP